MILVEHDKTLYWIVDDNASAITDHVFEQVNSKFMLRVNECGQQATVVKSNSEDMPKRRVVGMAKLRNVYSVVMVKTAEFLREVRNGN